MDIVTAIITPVVQSLLVPIKKHLGFLVSSSDKARDMHSKATELEGALHDMQTQRQLAETSRRVVPHRVPDWLAEVEDVKARAERIPAGGVGCFNLKTRYKVGKDSCDILKHIERLIKEKAEMVWPNEIVPLSAVPPATQEEDRNQNRFQSRCDLLNKALEILKSTDISSQKMALCGMGGIGKTTMMEEMKNIASNRHMFDHIVKVVVGEKPNLAIVQKVVEEQTNTGVALSVTIEENIAEQLKKRFKVMSEEGKKKILVILDDVWEEFDLKHIGLTSPLPTGFKLLLTSREEYACLHMGVQSRFIFRVELLKDPEAKKLFWETTGGDSHSELVKKIGEDIVKKCGGLPIAIKTIASTLIGIKEKHKWEDALFRIQNHDFSTFRIRDRDNRVLINIFQFSYENLQNDEIKAIFLLSGLYPEDYDIDIEQLVRYGWGLQFFKNLPHIAQARIRVKSYVDDLIRSNLLNKSERDNCVRMHDLVRDFVLISSSKVKQASNQLRGEESYDRILLNCKGLIEFPEDFNHPNLTLLKLMYGDELLKFPEDFYARMKKLEVLAYNNIFQPKLPQSLTNLRALCLSWCSLEDVDISFVGDLINLEILTLDRCRIRELPSKIGNLKKLKLFGLHEYSKLGLHKYNKLRIDAGIFQNMGKLEELYILGEGIRFTNANRKQLKMLKLFALELQFFKNKIRPIDVSFDKIERFRISVGCELVIYASYENISFKNTLRLVTNVDELRECKLNELFMKTEILHLVVADMYHLEHIMAPPPQNSFCMLKELNISGCENLTYMFTVSMVEGLTELESLKVRACPVLNTLIKSGDSDARVITFHKLKNLFMTDLPELESLCDFVRVMELPQLTGLQLDALSKFTSIFSGNNNNISAKHPLLKNEVVIKNLELLSVKNMKNLKERLACEITSFNQLRRIIFEYVQGVKVLFEIESPSNSDQQQPLQLLPYLEEIKLNNMDMLSHVWKCNNWNEFLILHKTSFQNLTTLRVNACKSIKYLFSPLMATLFSNLTEVSISYCDGMEQVVSNIDDEDEDMTAPTFDHATTGLFPRLDHLRLFDMSNLKQIGGGVGKGSANAACHGQHKVSPKDVVSWSLCQHTKEIWIASCDALSSVVPSYAAGRMQKLQVLIIEDCRILTEVFQSEEIHSNNISTTLTIPRVTNNIVHQLPNLKKLKISVCHSLKYVFTFSMLESLEKLKTLTVENCEAMKAIVKKEEEDCDAKVSEIKFPCLKSVELLGLSSLEGFCLGKEEFTFESLDTLEIKDCPTIKVFTEGPSITPNLTLIKTNSIYFNVVGKDVNAFIMKKRQEGYNFTKYSSEDDETSSEDN